MSNYGAPGQFDDADAIERQLQLEELRRRQALQQTSGLGTFSALRSQTDPYSTHSSLLGMQQTSSDALPYTSYARHASPYARGGVTSTPYAGIAEARAAYAGAAAAAAARAPAAAADTAGSLAQLYAAQQRRQEVQQSIASNYAAAYGSRTPAPTASTSLTSQYSAYGLPSSTSLATARPTTTTAYGVEPYSVLADRVALNRSALPLQNQDHLYDRALKSAVAVSALQPTARTPAAAAKKPATRRRRSPKADSLMLQVETDEEPPNKAKIIEKDGKQVIEDGDNIWYMGCLPLGVDDDKYWLSELQVFLRSDFAEVFGATEDDIAAPMHGRNKPIALGQVGIRCIYCKHVNPAERGQQSTSYPSLISGIYNSVQQMLRLHMDCCMSIPPAVRDKIEGLKVSCSSRGGRKQYWIDSAKRLGLVDTPHGIHFGRDPSGPLPPLSGPSVNSKESRRKRLAAPKPPPPPKPVEKEIEPSLLKPPPPVDSRPLVYPEDRALISDYLYLTLEQMAPCKLMEADRVGCYKTRKVGFPGLACRHCVGQAGCGRYFPASEASLSQTTTSQTIMNHVRNCRRCPIEIRENLEIMKRNRMGPDGKRADKPKHGGRKVFFHRLWCRIQDIPIQRGKGEPREMKKRKRGPGKKRKTFDYDDEMITSEEETESEDESEMSGDLDSKPSAKRRSTGSPRKKKEIPWVEGCVRLTKTDDPHWLSEVECFARSELVEVFSLQASNDIEGYSGRKEPAVGQVGIRCVFCKSLDPTERPNGCVTFPESLSSIQTKVTDMIRLHFPQCPSLPDDLRATFKSYRGFDAKVANDDSHQYWVDAARDIGLVNLPPGGHRLPGTWGITFRRDPLQPSPADELDLEQQSGDNGSSAQYGPNLLIRPDDRGLCTDQVLLLLRQVRPCRFQKSDRRAGPGSRGRDRAMGFPGLCCMHCVGRNTLGRYFPVSAKNLTDSTTNSLQSHVASCTYCPEPIKASLAYLGHRSILQKAELSGSWKKAFFKKVWDRLHVERGWTSIDDEAGLNSAEYAPGYEEQGGGFDHEDEEEEKVSRDDESDREEKEEMGTQMNALIKAAAIWLTEQDAGAASGEPKATRSSKSRSLPSAGTRGSSGQANGKRRRVHF